MALLHLALGIAAAGDLGETMPLVRQAGQVPGDIPGSITRLCGVWLTQLLTEADDFAAAEPVCAAAPAASQDAGDLANLPTLLARMALLDLQAGRTKDAAAHLQEVLHLASRTGTWFAFYLDLCGHLCAAAGRQAEAVTLWAAYTALLPREEGWPGEAARRQEPLRAARRALGSTGRGRPRNATRR
jgi:hypothetical protein